MHLHFTGNISFGYNDSTMSGGWRQWLLDIFIDPKWKRKSKLHHFRLCGMTMFVLEEQL